MNRVLCFGEILMRMSPTADQSWIQNRSMPVFVGGAELNVAAALACWHVPVSYCTAVPDNYLSDSILTHVNGLGIGIEPVIRTGKRIGIYYLQQGTDLKHAAVVYDRAHSSFSSLKPGMVDWDKTLHNISLFHFSAISPALGDDSAALCLEAMQQASRRNITISIDLNYRASLWKDGREPISAMHPLLGYCNIVMGNIWSAETLLGIPVDGPVQDNEAWYCLSARKTALAIQQKYPACRSVCNTFRFDKAGGGISYFATMDNADRQYRSPTLLSSHIVDKVGSGDCFMAGLIYGYMSGKEPNETLKIASRAAFMKMHEVGDATTNPMSRIISASAMPEPQ